MAAASISVPHTKLTRTRLCPSEDVDVISSTPGTVATISSMIWVTSRSITSGLAPSYSVRMVRVGSSMSGSMSICSRLRETAPRMTRIRVTMVVKIGRWTLKPGRFIEMPSSSRTGSAFALLLGNRDGRAVL